LSGSGKHAIFCSKLECLTVSKALEKSRAIRWT